MTGTGGRKPVSSPGPVNCDDRRRPQVQGAPGRLPPATPIPLGVASGARFEGIGLSPLQAGGKPIPSRRDADTGLRGWVLRQEAERYAEPPGAVVM